LLIKSRQLEESSPKYLKYALHIFPTKKDVDSHNSQTLKTLQTTILTLKSKDIKKDKETGQLKRNRVRAKRGPTAE
jgi:hypothetical protein